MFIPWKSVGVERSGSANSCREVPGQCSAGEVGGDAQPLTCAWEKEQIPFPKFGLRLAWKEGGKCLPELCMRLNPIRNSKSVQKKSLKFFASPLCCT